MVTLTKKENLDIATWSKSSPLRAISGSQTPASGPATKPSERSYLRCFVMDALVDEKRSGRDLGTHEITTSRDEVRSEGIELAPGASQQVGLLIGTVFC